MRFTLNSLTSLYLYNSALRNIHGVILVRSCVFALKIKL